MANPITIDAMGLPCPIPVVKTKEALSRLTAQNAILVHVDNEIAVQNLTKMAKQKKLDCASEKLEASRFIVTIRQSGATVTAPAAAPEETACIPDSRRNAVVVAVGSKCMGSGDDVLGGLLMKGFIYALANGEQLPGSILFYNGGAFLTTEGSDSLEDLRSLEAQGVEILTCGACLNHFGLSEKLEVGSVTNMYVIAEKLLAASSVVRP